MSEPLSANDFIASLAEPDELRKAADIWDRLEAMARKEGDKWDAARCAGEAVALRRLARRKEAA